MFSDRVHWVDDGSIEIIFFLFVSVCVCACVWLSMQRGKKMHSMNETVPRRVVTKMFLRRLRCHFPRENAAHPPDTFSSVTFSLLCLHQ